MDCSKRSFMGSQLIFSNLVKPMWSLLLKFKQKRIHLLCSICSFFFRLLFKEGYQAEHPKSKWGCIVALQRSLRSDRDRNLFFLYKNLSLVLIFLMTCKAIGSPDRFSSSTQPIYETVWYCLICTVPYLILKLISFFNRFFVPNNMHLVLSSPKWIIGLLLTNQLQILEKFLLRFFSIALASLCWYTKQESSA